MGEVTLFSNRVYIPTAMTGVYGPAEDSLLLLRHAMGRIKGAVLDMGTGSGILAVEAAQEPGVTSVFAIDIDPEAVGVARGRAEDAGVQGKVMFTVGDLFKGLGDARFDWILFNPPYLPSEGEGDEVSWAGGEVGYEVFLRFLAAADEHLNPGGAIIAVVSSRMELDLDEVERKYDVEVLEELPLFFEGLYCLLLRPL